MKIKSALCGNQAWQLERVFGQGRREHLELLTNLHSVPITSVNFPSRLKELENVEVLFTTWGMDYDLAAMVSQLPNLKACFHAAGTVQSFARPLLNREIVLVSGWAANAIPVAQFTLGQILLSLKGYFRNVRETRLEVNRGRIIGTQSAGIFGGVVALLGCGMVGKAVAESLRSLEIETLVFDPFLSVEEAKRLRVIPLSLEAAFKSADVVSNHLADLPGTRGLLGRNLFASMRQNATFINTGRGATVVEADLIDSLLYRPDLTALLDVTSPEPPEEDSPLYSLPNVQLSSHIAGSVGKELVRMADICLEEFESWSQGRPLKFQVTLRMLENMA